MEDGITRHEGELSATDPVTAYLAGFFQPNGVGCCRIGQFGMVTLNNRQGLPYPLETEVFPLSGNSSPVSSMVPIVIVPPHTNVQFLVPAADADSAGVEGAVERHRAREIDAPGAIGVVPDHDVDGIRAVGKEVYGDVDLAVPLRVVGRIGTITGVTQGQHARLTQAQTSVAGVFSRPSLLDDQHGRPRS